MTFKCIVKKKVQKNIGFQKGQKFSTGWLKERQNEFISSLVGNRKSEKTVIRKAIKRNADPEKTDNKNAEGNFLTLMQDPFSEGFCFLSR